MNFLRRLAPYKKLIFFGAVAITPYILRSTTEKYRLYDIFSKASDLSGKRYRNCGRTFILLNNKSGSYKNFKKYAEPIFYLSSAEYTIVHTHACSLKDTIDSIVAIPNSKIIIAGDDPYINQNINFLYTNFPDFLGTSSIGLIPTGTVTRIGESLKLCGLTVSSLDVARSAYTCLIGVSTPIYPLVVTCQDNDFLVIDAIMTGHLALYEKNIVDKQYGWFTFWKLPLYFVSVSSAFVDRHSLHYNICNQHSGTLESSSFLIRNS
ncbi:hypothetical protein MXB_4685, partial [Myxobolus squamalis]